LKKFLKTFFGGVPMYRRIRNLREDKDMNQTSVAKILGMSQTGYSKYETGENDIPTAILIKLADYYGVSVDYILERTNNPKMNM
jgi:transcriptional regulator with XRE-family HTH domain